MFTLDENTPLDKVNVRRLLNHLEKTIAEALEEFRFELNTAAAAKHYVDHYLAALKERGDIYGYEISEEDGCVYLLLHPAIDFVDINTTP